MQGILPSAFEPGAYARFVRVQLRRQWRRTGRQLHHFTRLLPDHGRPDALRNLVHGLGAIVALITALSVPLGYCFIGYLKEASALTYKAELTAMRAAQYIYAPDAPWRYDTDQLASISEIRTPTAAPIFQRILDLKGQPMMQKGAELAWPTFTRTAPIIASNAPVGEAEVTASLRPLLTEVLLISIGSLLLGIGAYLAFAVLPLRAVDRSFAGLNKANALLQDREDELRAKNLRLDAALENMFQGLAMFDAGERIVIANDRFAEMYQLSPEEVQPGTTLRELAELRIARGLYKELTADDVINTMRERVARGRVSHITSRLGDGRTILVSIRPRADGGWVTTHQDITERENLAAQLAQQNELLQQREEELRAWNLRLDAALTHMSQGLCLYNGDQRVVVANAQFAELYGLTPEQVQPGTPLEQIVQARIAKGLYAGDSPDEYRRERLSGFHKSSTTIQRLSDGRDICISRRPMRGGGWVTTHEDVSERERLKEELQRQNDRLDAALNNMSQSLAMFDSEQRLVVCNKRFLETYRLEPEHAQPGTTLRQILEHRVAVGTHSAVGAERFVEDVLEQFSRASNDIHELADGRVISVRRRVDAKGGCVVTHEDITERQRLHELLEHNNRLLTQRTSRLQAIIENFPGGISFLDSEFRVVFCNEKARRLLDLPDALFAGGPPSIEEVFRFNALRGEYGMGNSDEQVAKRMALVRERQPHVLVRERPDGTVLDVRGVPLEDGGFVTTYMDITERRRSEEKIAHMALHDALTGLANRVLFNSKIELALARVKRGEMVAIHLLDLDHFKNVNDTLGHPAGDKLLKEAASRLHALVRETDTIARMGGDEFAILQVAIAHPSDATALAQRVIESVSRPYELDGREVVIGTSVGIAVGPTDGVASDQLMRNADLALYRAKGNGRGTYRFFEPDMDAQMQERRAIECDLRTALAHGQFELYYQPVVHLITNEIRGFEALIRWRHPERGMIPPNSFIGLAEEIGFIVPLGEWVLRQACSAAAQWPGNLRVSVNLSPVQFKNPGLVQVVVSALAASGLPADRLELEITESALLDDSEATLSMLYRLRELGVRIAMDDFGTGYSSLAYLQSFPFDRIKIDRSFIKDIDEVSSLNIVRAMSALARGLGMETTAEGVETDAQLDTVRSEGCTEMQGFLFSRPLPSEEVASFLAGATLPELRQAEAASAA